MPAASHLVRSVRRILLAALVAPVATAQHAEPPPGVAEKHANATLVAPTRRDVAEAYLNYESWFFRCPRDEATERRVNLEFEGITQLFFVGQFGEACARLRKQARRIEPYPETDGDVLWAMIRVRAAPEIIVAPAGNVRAAVQVRSFVSAWSDVRIDQPLMSVCSPSGCDCGNMYDPQLLAPIHLNTGEAFELDALADIHAQPVPASHDVSICGQHVTVVTTPEPLSVYADKFAKRLEAAATTRPELDRPIAIAKARAALLTDTVSDSQAASFRQNLAELCNSVESEVAMIEGGANPYLSTNPAKSRGMVRSFGIWRPIITPTRNIPCCVFPSHVWPLDSQPIASMPLVIALHGAGGDEFMFVEGYGDGKLPLLAGANRFVLASPHSYSFLTSPAAFDALVEQIAADYPIDRDRIYLIGHSMGGAAVAQLVHQRADVIAAAVGIAPGGTFVDAKGQSLGKIPPVRWVAAELDQIIPAARVRKAAEAARDAGLPVESVTIPNYGHTLAVGKDLPDAVAWLLMHKRGDSVTK